MRTIHLIYPHGSRISCPDAIGRKIGLCLEQDYKVLYYNLESPATIHPGPDDILVGHAIPSPYSIFRRSLKQPGWRRVILITPFAHGDPRYYAFVDRFIDQCDLYLAITGRYWFQSLNDSAFARWSPKMVHLDLAVDRQDFPVLKDSFNPIGKRSFVYIGIYKPYKNLGYLSRISGQLPGSHFDWIGVGRSFPNLKPLGALDFSLPDAQEFVRKYDFMITVGNSDPNPTTILEAMAWGLIPVCTEQSGYTGYPGIVNLPLDNLDEAVNIIQRLQDWPEAELKGMQQVNWKALDEHFNWDRFTRQVKDAIESEASPSLEPSSARRRLYLRWIEWLSPYAAWRRPRHLSRVLAYAVWHGLGA
jgi:glycosyltransferase involved in cell wall biosynthesis